MTPRLLSYQDAAAVLTVSLSTLKRLVSRGELPAVRLADSTSRIRVVDLDEYVAALAPAERKSA